ncbi:unnamed protein product [Brugia timori]|uniref:Uncharacterized protein n=1 Tax=Brugia timori TaxID=42155 RepID=A0A0R3QAY2_9BILA|nr:unnamed protein product [Brugia timori]
MEFARYIWTLYVIDCGTFHVMMLLCWCDIVCSNK